ncbi:MAG: AI-2E family transporter [Bryobacterales bacterium]|nr:AI-2E family transporter [Bryobacteraceae bacterium]MDW8354136.1 AI-2E family transporter [Bryobacterales bacterium]
MLGWDARAARAAWTVFLIGLAVVIVYRIRRTVLIFTLAMLLAYLIAPLVDLIERVAPRKLPRTLRLAVVYVALIAAVVAGAASLGSRIATEAVQLARHVPEWLAHPDLAARIPAPAWAEPWKEQALETARQQLAAHAKEALPLLSQVVQRAVSLITNLGFVILVPILSFFFLKDAGAARERLLAWVAEGPGRSFVEDVLGDVHVLLGQFMRALVLLAAATFVCYGLFFWAIGLPYAALLAGLAGALEFIPVLGPLTAAIVILLVALLAGQVQMALWILAFLLMYRLFQDYVLQPYLMSAGVALHPLWVIFGVLAGEQIGGVAGMFLSIPVLATLRVIVVRLKKLYGPRVAVVR